MLEHDHIREQAVQKLIHQFEITRTKKHYKQTYNKIARSIRSAGSKETIYSMGNIESFDICEITPNIQCPNCMTYWPKRDCYDVLSIPNYAI